jgi:hypothetical protein
MASFSSDTFAMIRRMRIHFLHSARPGEFPAFHAAVFGFARDDGVRKYPPLHLAKSRPPRGFLSALRHRKPAFLGDSDLRGYVTYGTAARA